jgi:hypothetical protein
MPVMNPSLARDAASEGAGDDFFHDLGSGAVDALNPGMRIPITSL